MELTQLAIVCDRGIARLHGTVDLAGRIVLAPLDSPLGLQLSLDRTVAPRWTPLVPGDREGVAALRRPDPAVEAPGDARVLGLALVACSASIAALLLHWVGWIRMPYTVSFLSLPGMVAIVALIVWSRRSGRELLFNRMLVGTIGAALGLVAYDVLRWLVQVALPVDFDAFAAFPTFGNLMTGRPRDDTVAIAAGWAYHVTNGWTFGIIYTLLAGPARWWWGLAWGGALEAAMMVVYPSLLRPASISSFVIVSVIGHTAFGAVVGLVSERHAMAARR